MSDQGYTYHVSSSPLNPPKDSDTIFKELNGFMEELRSLKEEEDQLEAQLKRVRDKKSRIDRECSVLSTWYVLISRIGER